MAGYLCGDSAAYVTGEVIGIDGGESSYGVGSVEHDDRLAGDSPFGHVGPVTLREVEVTEK